LVLRSLTVWHPDTAMTQYVNGSVSKEAWF